MSGIFLRQATASQSRAIGPFVDDTDFKTPETALTIANTDIKLVVNGAASANKNSGGGTHRVNGVYGVTFDATDTATVGEMEVSVVVAGALPVFHKFTVLEEATYDITFAAGATGAVPVASIAANAITATAINADAITAAKLAADVTTELQTGLATAAALATVDGTVNAILTDTAEIGVAGAGLTNINLPDQAMNIVGNITGNLSGSVGSVTGAVGSVSGAVGSVAGNVSGNVTGSVGSVVGNVGGNVVGSVASVVGSVGSVTGLTASNLDTTVSSRLAPTTTLAESYAADGAAPTLQQILLMILQNLAEFSISGTTITVKKLDGSTTAMTYTLNSAVDPITSRTRTT